MKKSIFFAVLVVCAFSLSSCSSDEKLNVVKEQTKPAFDEVKASIAALNVETFGQIRKPETRARWWKWLVTIAVDAGAGFGTGNAAVGVSASTLTWTMLKSENVKNQSIHPVEVSMQHIAVEELNYIRTDIDMGYVHNKVLVNLYEKYGESIFNLTDETLIPLVNKEVATLTGQKLSSLELESSYVLSETKKYINAFNPNGTIEEYFSNIKRFIPLERHAELDVLEVALEGLLQVDINTDNGKYASDVITIVNNSDLTTLQKNNIINGVAVGNASRRLWVVE